MQEAGRPPHDHVVGFYEGDDALITAVAEFFGESLAAGGGAVVIATPAHREMLNLALEARGLSTAMLTSSGRYESLDAQEVLATFMRNGAPDARKFLRVLGGVLDRVACAGAPIRAFGEMVGLLWDDGNVAAAIELESLWNDLAADHEFMLYCGYAQASFDREGDLHAAQAVCRHHSDLRWLPRVAPPHAASEPFDVETGSRVFMPTRAVLPSVRKFVRDMTRTRLNDDRVYDAELIAAELATNALMHAQSPFRVTITHSASTIAIGVGDTSRAEPRSPTRPTRLGGCGVVLVGALSSSFRTEVEADGKTVWAELSVP